MDIRHLTNPEPTGIGAYTIHLLRALFCLDQKNEYILFSSGTKKALARLPTFPYPNVKTAYLPFPNVVVSAQLIGLRQPPLERLLRAQPDLWFFPNLNRAVTRLPYVLTIHDLSFRIFPEFFSPRMRLWHRSTRPKHLIRNARAILCPSICTKEDIIEIYDVPEKKIHVTHLAPAPPNAPNITKISPSPYLLSLATMEPRKNQLAVIRAYEAYRDKTKNPISLVIAGAIGWKAAPILAAARASIYAKDIQLLGYVTESQKELLMARASIFLFPSFYEGYGLPVMEAMRHGVPVIASHTGSLPEIAGNAAVLIDPYNVGDLTRALCELLTSPTLRQTISELGKIQTKKFSWKKTAEETLKVFSAVTNFSSL